MNPDSILEQLRDIHSPTAITWWPFAIGWWILGISALVITTTTVYLMLQRYRRNAWRRAALKEFETLKQSYLEQANTESLANINALLKRCLSSAHSDPKYLSYINDQWVQCLSYSTKQIQPILNTEDIDLLSSGQYQADCKQLTEPSFNRIEKWIKKLR